MEKYNNIQQFMDEEGRIMQWPSRRRKSSQRLILKFLLEKFSTTTQYSEREVNELLNKHHTFGDAALLRRELFEQKMLARTIDCRAYWVREHATT